MSAESWFIIKGLALAVLSYAASFVGPISHFIFLAMALVLADFITGIAAAKKRKDTISSRGFVRTTKKFMLYAMAICLAEGMEWVFFENYKLMPITYTIAIFLCITEFKSILENVEAITGTATWPAVSKFFNKFINNNKQTQ